MATKKREENIHKETQRKKIHVTFKNSQKRISSTRKKTQNTKKLRGDFKFIRGQKKGGPMKKSTKRQANQKKK